MPTEPTYRSKEAQIEALAQLVPEWAVRKSPDVKGAYTTGDYVTWCLNRIFGPANWGTMILDGPHLVTIGEAGAYSQATVRLTVTFADGTTTSHDDVGVVPFVATRAKQGGTLEATAPERYETVIKSAVTDAIKASAERIGNCFRPLADLELDNFIRSVILNPHRGRPVKELISELQGEEPPPPPPATKRNPQPRSKAAKSGAPDNTTPPPQTKPQSAVPPKPCTLTPEQVRDTLNRKIATAPELHQGSIASDGQRGLIAGKLNECFAGSPFADERRHVVLEWLVGAPSTKDLSMADASALLDWLLSKDADPGTYDLRPTAAAEAAAIYAQALKDQGQSELPLDT